MVIRKFRLGDLPRLLQIERAAFGPASSGTMTFAAHVLRDRSHSFVAQDEEGAVVGYALVRMTLGWLGLRRGGITSIAVDPPRRRRGTGRALMSHALEYLAEHDVVDADLEVGVNNRAAQSLYEAFGFRRARLLPQYYGEQGDGLRMVADLRRGEEVRNGGAGGVERGADG